MGSGSSSSSNNDNDNDTTVSCPAPVTSGRVDIVSEQKSGKPVKKSVYEKRREFANIQGASELGILQTFVTGGDNMNGAYELAMSTFYGNKEVNGSGKKKHRHSFFEGGSSPITLADLAAYEKSTAATMKEDIIRKIARALNNAGLNIDDKDSNLDNIIMSMKKVIPNPNTNKQTFANDAEKHKRICGAIAKVLNEQFTPGASNTYEKFINTDMSPADVCKHVAEWVHSFAVGVNTEFLAVYNSIQNAMRNINILDAFLDVTFRRINELVSRSSARKESEPLIAFYKMVKNESTRQKEMLKNILNVSLPPEMKELNMLIGSEGDIMSFIKKINYDVGTQSFSTALTSVLGSLNVVSDITNRVHKALKMLHIKLNDYLKDVKYEEFVNMIEKKFQERLKSSTSLSEMDDLIMAAKLLQSNFNERTNMEDTLSKIDRGHDNTVEGGAVSRRTASDMMSLIYGVEDKEDDKTDLEKKVERIQKMKVILIKKFINAITILYSKFNQSVSNLGHKFGKFIPVSEQTDRLRDIIVKLGEQNLSRIELALIEYYTDASAREMKEKYVNIMHSIVTAINEILSKTEYKPFAKDFDDLKSIIHDILNTIRIYADALRQKIDKVDGVSGSHEDTPEEIAGASCGCTPHRSQNSYDTYDNVYGNKETTNKKQKQELKAIDPDFEIQPVKTGKAQRGRKKKTKDNYDDNDDSESSSDEDTKKDKDDKDNDDDSEEDSEEDSDEEDTKKNKKKKKKTKKDDDEDSDDNNEEDNEDYSYNANSIEGGKQRRRRRSKKGGNNPFDYQDMYAYDLDVGYTDGFADEGIDAITGGDNLDDRQYNLNTRNISIENIQDVYQAISKSQWTLNSAISNFKYFYYISRVYKSLSSAATETEEAGGAKYIEILGDTCASEIRKLYTQRDALQEKLKDELMTEALSKLNINDQYHHIDPVETLPEKFMVNDEPNPNNPFIENDNRPFMPRGANIVPQMSTLLSANVPNIPVNQMRFQGQFTNFIARKSKELQLQFKIADIISRFLDAFNQAVIHNPADYLNIPVHLIDNYNTEITNLFGIINANTVDSQVPVLYARTTMLVKDLLLKYKNDIVKFMNSDRGAPFKFLLQVIPSDIVEGTKEGGTEASDLAYFNTYVGYNNIDTKEAIANLRTLIDKEFETKVNLYKVVQAIDIYLKEFTVEISKNPDAVKDIAKILDGTHVIVDWFNEQTGDNLWKAFECMGTQSVDPVLFARQDLVRTNPNYADTRETHNYQRFIMRSMYLPGQPPAVRQVDTEVLSRFNIYHNWLVDHKIPVIAESRDNKHYYEALYDAIVKAKNANNLVPNTAQQCVIADPYIGVPCKTNTETDRFKMSAEFLSNSVDTFQALKNLLNAFVRIGETFSGNEIYKKIFMSPTQIYKYLIDYIKTSAYFINYGKSPDFKPDNKCWVPEFYISFAKATDSTYNNFVTENKYFSMIIKAMASKILVVLGIFEIFDRKQTVQILDPIRMITGGFNEKLSNIVIPEAAELYFRLPRLAEFYRKLLLWRGDKVSNKISMIPEMSGSPFSEFFRLIFQKIYAPELGNYSDYDAKLVISEINDIYKYYHSSVGKKQVEVTNHFILSEFVKEINRRIGIIKAEDMKKYWKLQQKVSSPDQAISEFPSNNYRILPQDDDMDDYGITLRLAPSDRYLFKYFDDKTGKVYKPIDKEIARADNIKLLSDFRDDIESMFDQYKPDIVNSMDTISYSTQIKEAEKEMKENKPDIKMQTALKLIQATREINIESEKLVMFHETVIAGLNALGSIYDVLRGYQEFIRNIDPVQAELAFITKLLAADTDIERFNNIPDFMGMAADDNKRFVYNEQPFLSERMAYDRTPNVSDKVLNLRSFIVLCKKIKIDVNNHYRYDSNEIKTSYTLDSLTSFNNDSKSYIILLHSIARFAVDYQNIMYKLIENIFALNNDDLVSVKIITDSTAPIQLNFSNLVSTVETMLDEIKMYINKFRTVLPTNIIDQFEKVSNIGSVYWFEREFIDKMFKGTTQYDDNDTVELGTLSELNTLTNKVFNNLVRNTASTIYGIPLDPVANLGQIPDAPLYATIKAKLISNAINPIEQAKNNYYEYYGNMLSEITYYNNTSYAQINLEFDNVIAGPNLTFENALIGAVNPLQVRARGPGYNIPAPGAAPAGAAGPATYSKTASGIEKLMWKGRVIGTRENELPNIQIPDLYRLAIWDKYEYTEHRSLLFAFNQLLALHINTSVDQLTYKVYSGLLDPLTNNIANNSIYNPRGGAYPDLFINGADTRFGRRGDPQSDKIIVSSLAYILQRLTRDTGQSSIGGMGSGFDYLITTMTDVPNYIKDRYKYSLPYTYKLFNVLIRRCEFMKDVIQKTKINCTRSSQNKIVQGNAIADIGGGNAKVAGIVNLTPDDYNALQPLVPTTVDSETIKQNLSSLIDSILQLSLTIQSGIYSTINELSSNESMKYMETSPQFISMYQQRYNKVPLMPISFALYPVRDLPAVNRADGTSRSLLINEGYVPNIAGHTAIFDVFHNPLGSTFLQDVMLRPNHLPGSTFSKLQYGLRPIVSDMQINIMSYPGVKDIIDKYNNISTNADNIEPNKFTVYLKNFVSIIKYNLDIRNFKSYIQPLFTSRIPINYTMIANKYYSLINTIPRNTYYGPYNAILPSFAYDVARRDVDIIYAIESTNQEEELTKIINKVKADKRDNNRMSECIINLLDLNIIPINLNVLMKEIPLFNIYNYDYTFELLVIRMYNKKFKDFKDSVGVFDKIRDTQDALIAFLFHPYINLDVAAENNRNTKMYLGANVPVRDNSEFISRIMRGDNNLGLGRPKFLSDQIFNKCLLRSLYPSIFSLDEAGITESVGIYKGQYGSMTDNTNLDDLQSVVYNTLTYPSVNNTTGKMTIKQCVFEPAIFDVLQNVGRLRFDSSIIRNLFLIVNVLRITRFKLYNELTSNRNVVVSSHYAVNKNLTEYGEFPFDINEIYSSKNILGESRFNI